MKTRKSHSLRMNFFFHLQLHSEQSLYWNARIFQLLHSRLYSNRWKAHRYNVCSLRLHHMYHKVLLRNVRNLMYKIFQLTIHFFRSIRSSQRAKSRKNQQRVDIANKHSISRKCFVSTNVSSMRKNLSSIHIFRSMQSNQHANRRKYQQSISHYFYSQVLISLIQLDLIRI